TVRGEIAVAACQPLRMRPRPGCPAHADTVPTSPIPTHGSVLAVLAATLSALLLAAPARAVLSPARLLARYQPVQVLHPDEAFRPVAVGGFLRTAVLEERTASGEWIPAGRPP